MLRAIRSSFCVAPLPTTELASRRLHDMSCYIIRPGRDDDCEDIIQMFKDLAEHQKAANEVYLTPDDLKKNETGEEPKLKCFVAERTTSDDSEEAGSLIGCGLFFYTYSPWKGRYCSWEGIYVKPEWRCKGVGTAIWAHITKASLANGCSRILWFVAEWNKATAEDFYKRRGAVDVT